MHKRERQDALIEIVSTESVSSQSELADRLTAAGHGVTQASVSRDLDELGIGKQDGRYVLPEPKTTIADFNGVRFDTAGDNLIVGKCASGMASAITVKIDAATRPEIVGTIAGDDTIFIAVKNIDARTGVLEYLAKAFE